MKHKVLIITYYWPPSGGSGVQRWVKFAKYLPVFGIEPVILTVENPTYPIKDPSLKGDIREDIQVYKSKTVEPFRWYAGLSGEKAESIKPTVELTGKSFKSKLGSWIRANIFIPDARAGWLFTAKRKARKLVKELDISTVITTGPPHSVHFIGKHVKEKTGIQWIADFRDPWSEIYYNQVLPKTRLARAIDKKMERTILKNADQVVVVTPTQSDQFKKIIDRNYQVITNGFDPEDFDNLFTSLPEPPPVIIRHVGSISEAAVPEAFLDAVQRLQSKFELKVEFIGSVHNRLAELIKEKNLSSIVKIRDYLPHHEALKAMCSSHFLLLIIPDVGHISHHIPGKLFEYIGSNRPVISIGAKNGDAAAIINDLPQGVIFNHTDISELEDYLKKALQDKMGYKKFSQSKDLGQNHPYSRLSLTKQLSELIKDQTGNETISKRKTYEQ